MLEEDQEQKHICKFCSKSFPCGRSLGGHMRTHLITVTSSDCYKSGRTVAKKRLPPLGNEKRCEFFGGQFGGKPNKALKLGKEDALLEGKHCRQCGKSFSSCKALFGHMKCHSVNQKMVTTSVGEDSWSNISKQGMDSESDISEPESSSCRRKRSASDRTKRYIANTNSSSSADTKPFPIDQIKQVEKEDEAEVALSLIILSRDKGDQTSLKSFTESSYNASEFLQPKNIITSTNAPTLHPNKSRKGSKHNSISNTPPDYNHQLALPYTLQTREDQDTTIKFKCSICKKGFPSYQALGGHRASHKKFKGCCIGPESHTPPSDSPSSKHECPICFKVFASGQALGGHKRSHLLSDQAKSNTDDQITVISKTRRFLDLNLPARDEEGFNESKPWWVHDDHDQKLLLTGLISS